MLVKTYSAAVNGLEVTTVTVEVSIVKGMMYHFTGLGDVAVKEGRDRIAAAMQFNGLKFPRADITVNMAPADLKKEGAGSTCLWPSLSSLPTDRSLQMPWMNI